MLSLADCQAPLSLVFKRERIPCVAKVAQIEDQLV